MAEEVQKSVIIDVIVKNEEAISNIEKAKKEIADLAAANKKLADEGKATSEVYIRNAEQIKALNKVIAANSKELQNNIKQQTMEEGSIKQMRAELSNLTAAYDSLSKAERNGAKGKEMLSHIQQLTGEIRDAEMASMRFGINVGNYPGVLGQAGGAVQKLATNMAALTGGATTVAGAFKGAAKATISFGKQLLKLLANPIVAIIAAIALVVMKLVDAFKKNDDAMTSLKRAFAAFQPILDIVNKAFSALAEIIGSVVLGISKLFTAVMSLIPGYEDAAKAAEDLVVAQDKLEDAEREYTVNSAKRSRDIAKLREEVADKEKYTVQERMAKIKEAQKLEADNLADQKRIAAERLRLEKERQRQEADTSDEAKNRIAELTAASIKAEEEYYKGMKKLQKEYNSFVAEEQKSEEEAKKKRAEAAKKAAEEAKQRRQKELAERRAAEDLALTILKDSLEKQEKLLRTAYSRKIEDLKNRLNDEKNLTAKARAAINEQIILLEAQLQIELGKLRETEAEKEFNRLKADYERRLELVGQDYDQRLRLQTDQLERERQQAIAAAAKAGEDVALVSAIYDKKIVEAKRAAEKAKSDAVKDAASNEVKELDNKYQRELQAVGKNEEARLQLEATYSQQRLERLKSEYEAIAAMTEEQKMAQYGSVEAWKSAVLAADRDVINANSQVMQSQTAITQHQQEQTKAVVSSFQGMGGTIQGIFDTLAETDERYSDFATAMALANIITSSAISIAAAIQAATQAGGFTGPAAPVTIPVFIAELVGIVASGITSAITTLNKAKQAKSQAKYAEGGLVDGTYQGREDTVTARLTPGEFVVNRRSTARNLPALLAINGGWGNTAAGSRFSTGGVAGVDDLIRGYQADTLRAVVTEAVSGIQPVVSVREITNVANRVKVKEIIAKS